MRTRSHSTKHQLPKLNTRVRFPSSALVKPSMDLKLTFELTYNGPLMTDRALLSAATHAIRTMMKRRQVTEQASLLETDPSAWAPPDPELEALAVKIDEVMYGRRAEAPGLVERIAGVLGDDWEP